MKRYLLYLILSSILCVSCHSSLIESNYGQKSTITLNEDKSVNLFSEKETDNIIAARTIQFFIQEPVCRFPVLFNLPGLFSRSYKRLPCFKALGVAKNDTHMPKYDNELILYASSAGFCTTSGHCAAAGIFKHDNGMFDGAVAFSQPCRGKAHL